MSQENVELVRRIYEASPRFDAGPEKLAADPGVAAFIQETFDPEVELEQRGDLPGTRGTFRGYAGLAASFRELVEAFEEIRFFAERMIDLDDRVAVDVRAIATGRGSGARLESRLGHLWTIKRERVVR